MTELEAGLFGDLLQRFRATAGLSQQELAERAGLSRRGISDLERGRRRAPYPATVRRLVRALGVSQASRAEMLAAVPTRSGRADVAHTTGTVADTTRSFERNHHNLPVALTSFVGRASELIQLQEVLSKARLVTLVGVGGAGKTRLAIEVAAQIRGSFADGAWFVDLADVSDAMLVPQRVGMAMELRDVSGRPARDVLSEHLHQRQILLVLDNCEHLIEACAELVEHLLSVSANLKVLATSREPLGITGEFAWRIPPLSAPTPTGESTMERAARHDAVQLLIERTASTVPGLTFTDSHAAPISEICRRLDGLPLAIELAAARLRILNPDQVADRLEDRFRLLTGGSRTAPPRHQTLRATLDWSYDLLDDSERLVFDRASVFAGGWTLDAAEAVCAAEGVEATQVLDLLTSLVDKSLVQAEPGAPGEPRYRLLETLRQYGSEQLARRVGTEATRRRHAAYFLAMAELAGPQLRGPQQVGWLRRLEREHDNFGAALGWAIHDDDPELGLRLAAALAEFWRRRGYIGEGMRWLERALEQAPDAPAALRAAAWYGAGSVARFVFSNVAQRFFSESVALRGQLRDERGMAEALAGLATASVAAASTGQLIQVLGQARALDANALLLTRGPWVSQVPGAADRITHNDTDPVDAMFEQSLALLRKHHDTWGIATCLSGMGNRAFASGDYSRAAVIMDEGLGLARAHGDAWQTSYLLHGLGHVSWMLGNQERSLALLEDGLVLCWDVGDRRGAATCLQSFALIAGSNALWDRAARLWAVAAAIRLAAGLMRWGQPWIRSREGLTTFDAVEATRAALGDEAFTNAWTAGSALSLEDAVTEARAVRALVSTLDVEHVRGKERSEVLSQRERQVVELVAQGRTNRQIGEALVITEGTAALHVKHVLAKLRFSSRAQIAVWASQRVKISTA